MTEQSGREIKRERERAKVKQKNHSFKKSSFFFFQLRMPRPGPRPYECVRRAWHSDRHQPIRGCLIQEIFRVVNEIHCSATKKNKEWQEILPIVVLKAEEILYSKATSKAEYMESDTLRDRLVDAINTIIQLDKTTETGEFVQPCIEAALNLGSTPRRASRSQRYNNSMSYLRFRNQDCSCLSPVVQKTSPGVVTHSRYIPDFWSTVKCVTIPSTHPDSRFQSFVASNDSTTANFRAMLSPHSVMENGLAMNKFSIYPLYYGNDISRGGQPSGSEITPKPISRSLDPANGRIMEYTSSFDMMVANGITQNDSSYSLEYLCKNACDLALRLGPLSASTTCYENKTPLCVYKDVGSGSSLKEKKSNDCSQQMKRKLPLFPMVNAYGISEGNSWERNFEVECVDDADARMSKRKEDYNCNRERTVRFISADSHCSKSTVLDS